MTCRNASGQVSIDRLVRSPLRYDAVKDIKFEYNVELSISIEKPLKNRYIKLHHDEGLMQIGTSI